MLEKIFKLPYILIILTVLFYSCNSRTKKQFYYDNGKISSSYYIDEKGLKDGVVYEYDTL